MTQDYDSSLLLEQADSTNNNRTSIASRQTPLDCGRRCPNSLFMTPKNQDSQKKCDLSHTFYHAMLAFFSQPPIPNPSKSNAGGKMTFLIHMWLYRKVVLVKSPKDICAVDARKKLSPRTLKS